MAARKKGARAQGQRAFWNEGLALQVSIDDLPHPVTRELHVHASVTLDLLHDVLQIAFGWTNSHLYQFEVGDVVFSEGELDQLPFVDADAAPLGAVAVTGGAFAYVYDFGDDWRHTIRVTDLVELEEGTLFRCIAGQNAAPPEDCGGPPGFENLLEALGDPRHPEHRELKRWVGNRYDAKRCDLNAIEKQLAKLRREVVRAAARADRARGA